MSRLILRFAKGRQARFISHLDTMRLFQRALRRARIPVAYSQGFHPHPKLSFASALSVGMTSTGEYLELELQTDHSGFPGAQPDEIACSLNHVLPESFRILAYSRMSPRLKSLMSLVSAAQYVVYHDEMSAQDWSQRAADLMQRDTIVVERKTKKGTRRLDLRPLIYQLRGLEPGVPYLCLTLAHGSKQTARPTEVLQMLELDPLDCLIHRTSLFTETSGKLRSLINYARDHQHYAGREAIG